jgi:hypothetical protein
VVLVGKVEGRKTALALMAECLDALKTCKHLCSLVKGPVVTVLALALAVAVVEIAYMVLAERVAVGLSTAVRLDSLDKTAQAMAQEVVAQVVIFGVVAQQF